MPLNINPPLINSSNPWATTAADLRALYDCPDTGAVTVRTSLLEGFEHDDKVHKYAFFEAQTHTPATTGAAADSSLNTLGYSPISLGEYLSIIEGILHSPVSTGEPEGPKEKTINGSSTIYKKPVIVSVTGTPTEIAACRSLIAAKARTLHHPLYMEVNLSCPNIRDKPPPAYDGTALREYLAALHDADTGDSEVPAGIKLPPYTYMDQFKTVIAALLASTEETGKCPVDFIISTNTLGSSLLLAPSDQSPSHVPALAASTDPASTGIGGLAGAALHPLSLGNVATLRRLLDACGNDAVRAVEIIGIGGVSDRAGFDRMRAVGASVVGVGTALGIGGVGVFAKIAGRV